MGDRSSNESAGNGNPNLQRREFLKRAGLLGGGLAGMSIIAACGGTTGSPPTSSGGGGAAPPTGATAAPAGAAAGAGTPAAAAVAKGASQTLKATKPAQGPGGGKPLIFRGWNYHPEVVVDNVRIFNEQYGENVDYQTISGDYIPLIDKIHINKEALNLAYSQNSSLHKWYGAGWVWDLEGHWNIENYKKELYPTWRDMATTRDGKLIALPYFQSVRGTICTNEDMLAKAGITEKEWPKTYTELYDQCYQIKKMGITDVPLLPQWYGTFLVRAWGYQAEIENRGGKLFDEQGHPVFDDMSYQVLDNAAKLVSDGIVPKEMFTFQETDFVDAFSSGRYAYSAQQIYDNKVHNDPEKSKIARPHTKGGSRIVPVDKQPWGFLENGFYTVIKRADQTPEEVARAFRLVDFFGYKDKSDKFWVSNRWAVEQALNSGYPSTLQVKEVQDAYATWMPNPPQMLKAMDSLFSAAKGFAVQKRAFYDEWNQKATPSLAEAMLGSKPVKQTVDELKDLANQLLEKNKRTDPD